MPSFSNQKRGDMDKVELVCVFCKKVDSGDGVWSNPDSYSTYEQKNSLCPDCCHLRFPRFYSDFKRHVKRRVKASRLQSSLADFRKISNQFNALVKCLWTEMILKSSK